MARAIRNKIENELSKYLPCWRRDGPPGAPFSERLEPDDRRRSCRVIRTPLLPPCSLINVTRPYKEQEVRHAGSSAADAGFLC